MQELQGRPADKDAQDGLLRILRQGIQRKEVQVVVLMRKEIVHDGCRAITTEGKTDSYRGNIYDAFNKTCQYFCTEQRKHHFLPIQYQTVQMKDNRGNNLGAHFSRPCRLHASNAGDSADDGSYIFAVVGLADCRDMHKCLDRMEEEIGFKEWESDYWKEWMKKHGEQPPVGYVNDEELKKFIDRYNHDIFPPLTEIEKRDRGIVD